MDTFKSIEEHFCNWEKKNTQVAAWSDKWLKNVVAQTKGSFPDKHQLLAQVFLIDQWNIST